MLSHALDKTLDTQVKISGCGYQLHHTGVNLNEGDRYRVVTQFVYKDWLLATFLI